MEENQNGLFGQESDGSTPEEAVSERRSLRSHHRTNRPFLAHKRRRKGKRNQNKKEKRKLLPRQYPLGNLPEKQNPKRKKERERSPFLPSLAVFL